MICYVLQFGRLYATKATKNTLGVTLDIRKANKFKTRLAAQMYRDQCAAAVGRKDGCSLTFNQFASTMTASHKHPNRHPKVENRVTLAESHSEAKPKVVIVVPSATSNAKPAVAPKDIPVTFASLPAAKTVTPVIIPAGAQK